MRAASWAVQAALLLHVQRVAADLGPYVNDTAYATGKYGHYPMESYMTFDNDHVPRLHIAKHSPECDDGRFYFLTPSINVHASPFDHQICSIGVFDTRGNLVWHRKSGESVDRAKFTHVTVQTHRGQQYLTYFVGNTGVIGHGAGDFHMLDTNYNLAYTISAHGDIDADFHEFTITEQGTALFTAYGLRPANLSHWGESEHGQAWDGVFQEIDIETNTLLFEWRASDHFTFADMLVDSYSRSDVENTDGFDWYHINSIEKDPKGNYLISSRYASTVTYIDGRTGDIIWNLGGLRNDFRDISNEANASTTFFCQHMPRWVDNYTAITLFDNQAYWGDKRKPSRVLKIRLDTERMTSQLVTSWQHPANQWSEFAGSASVLEDTGNIFVGYGYQPTIAEFSTNGTLLCDTHFASQGLDQVNLRGGQDSGSHSYRAFKQSWTAYPAQPPDTVVVDKLLFVSWNGATEVRSWSLQARLMAGGLVPVGRVQKDSFESSIPLENIVGSWRVRRYRLKALGDNDRDLGTWLLDTSGRHIAEGALTSSDFYSNPFAVAAVLVVVAVIVRLGLGGRRLAALYKACTAQCGSALRLLERLLPFPLPREQRKMRGEYVAVRPAEEMGHLRHASAP